MCRLIRICDLDNFKWENIYMSWPNPLNSRSSAFRINMWIFKAPIGLSDIYVVMICYLLTMTNVYGGKKSKGKKADVEETEAIERLSRVFGIEHAPEHNVHSTPPQFMLTLFDDITDSGGLIKKDCPYNASTIVSFPDRGETLRLLRFCLTLPPTKLYSLNDIF